MKNIQITSSGSFENWESAALDLLNHYNYDFGSRLPQDELVTRGMQRLSRVPLADIRHLKALLPRIVRQILIDYGRTRARQEARFVRADLAKIPFPAEGGSEFLEERRDFLLGDQSPLDGFEKSILQAALEDPARFIRANGELEQSALAQRFDVVPSAIHYRWGRMREKIAQLIPSLEVQ